MLSAIIITRNEERDLPGCLESLRGLADEIIVVDSHSTDRTREIAKAAGAKVFERDWPGYGPQKQFALEQASGDWVINIDADERVTPALAAGVKEALAGPAPKEGYWIRFHVFFLGRRLRFGGCACEYHLRLFKRGKAHYAGGAIHEGITVEKPHGCLSGAIRHESYRNFSEYLEKCNRYTGLIAQKKRAQGKKFHFWLHARLPWEFLVRYVLKGGFIDGNAGLVYALLSAYYAWLKHARLLDGEEK